MSWRNLIAAGGDGAGATLTRDDCRAIAATIKNVEDDLGAACASRAADSIAAGVARADAASMQVRLFAAAAELEAERMRVVDAVVAGATVVCAWCGDSLASNSAKISAHADACTHHPFGRQRHQLAAAQMALAAHADLVDRVRAAAVAAAGPELVAALRDMVRAVFAADPDEIVRAERERVRDAVDAEALRWRRAVEAHGLHTMPANECFQRVLESMGRDHGPRD